MASSKKSTRKPRRQPIEIGIKKYLFNRNKFRKCFQNAWEKLSAEKSTKDQKYTKAMFKDDINKKYQITPENIASYISESKSAWPPLDKIYNLAEAFNCEPTDFLDELPQKKLEVSTMIKGYIEKDKEIVVDVYNEVIDHVQLLTEIKTMSIVPKKNPDGGIKKLDSQEKDFIEHLINTVHKNAIFTTDVIVEQLDNIIREIIEFLKYPVSYLPERWEDFSTDKLIDIGCVLSDCSYEEYYGYDYEKDLEKSPIQSYLREMYPESYECYFSLFYSQENLEHLYSMELATLIRHVFLADFSEMFEVEL